VFLSKAYTTTTRFASSGTLLGAAVQRRRRLRHPARWTQHVDRPRHCQHNTSDPGRSSLFAWRRPARAFPHRAMAPRDRVAKAAQPAGQERFCAACCGQLGFLRVVRLGLGTVSGLSDILPARRRLHARPRRHYPSATQGVLRLIEECSRLWPVCLRALRLDLRSRHTVARHSRSPTLSDCHRDRVTRRERSLDRVIELSIRFLRESLRWSGQCRAGRSSVVGMMRQRVRRPRRLGPSLDHALVSPPGPTTSAGRVAGAGVNRVRARCTRLLLCPLPCHRSSSLRRTTCPLL
jgi:hypothetical protein